MIDSINIHATTVENHPSNSNIELHWLRPLIGDSFENIAEDQFDKVTLQPFSKTPTLNNYTMLIYILWFTNPPGLPASLPVVHFHREPK
jgi:hypothetical protein